MQLALTLLSFVAGISLMTTAPSNPDPLVLDDFADPRGISTWGTRWSAFTDRVMGGVSDMETARHTGDTPHLHVTGDVRLDNNGGFVQVALPLDGNGRPFDAGDYRAVRLRVKGNGEGYYVHLRTNDTRAPWQYYAAGFDAPAEWTTVEIPFDAFEGRSLRTALDPSSLRRIAVVAYGERMRADVSIARIELIR